MKQNKWVAGLLAEREAYVRRGLRDKVRMVDEALAALGHRADDVVVETAAVDIDVEQAKVVRGRKRKKA
jgi:hypothetical protein